MQNSTAIQQVHNYKLRILKMHSSCVFRTAPIQQATPNYMHSSKAHYNLSDLHSGDPSPDNTILNQVLDPHKQIGPYQLTDGFS